MPTPINRYQLERRVAGMATTYTANKLKQAVSKMPKDQKMALAVEGQKIINSTQRG